MDRVDISSEPDMYIIAGTGTRRLYVNSVILKAASPVFKAMFGPNFAEGVSLKSSTMHEQLLPDDIEEVVELVLAMLHYAHDRIPESIWIPNLYSIAKFAHKYDLIDSLRSTVYTHCKCDPVSFDNFSMNNMKCGFEILAAAYIFKFPEIFAVCSNILILRSRGNAQAGASNEVFDYLPTEVFDAMNDAQMDMRARIATLWGERRSKLASQHQGWKCKPGEFFQRLDGKRSTVRDQIDYIKSTGIIHGSFMNWFETGLTYDVATGTVEWLGNLAESF